MKTIKVSLKSPDGIVSIEASSLEEFWQKTERLDSITAFMLEAMFRNCLEEDADEVT